MSETVKPVVDHSAVAESINASINYTMYAVFRRVHEAQLDSHWLLEKLSKIEGLTIRGWYSISGYRADADFLVWWHAPNVDTLQEAYRTLRTWGSDAIEPVWSNIGVHRAAEFNRGHVPAFLAGDTPRKYLCVYPFVRGREWYLLPEDERRELLREHGAAARDYGDVLANTVASFALGDYEWLLAFEAEDLIRIVDLMRDLRATGARRHVIEETPFFTGPRVEAKTLLTQLGVAAQ